MLCYDLRGGSAERGMCIRLQVGSGGMAKRSGSLSTDFSPQGPSKRRSTSDSSQKKGCRLWSTMTLKEAQLSWALRNWGTSLPYVLPPCQIPMSLCVVPPTRTLRKRIFSLSITASSRFRSAFGGQHAHILASHASCRGFFCCGARLQETGHKRQVDFAKGGTLIELCQQQGTSR